MYLLSNKKVIALIIIIIIALIIIKIFFFPSTTSQIKSILKKNGFELNDGIYIKETSEIDQEEYYDNINNNTNSYNETMYFDIDTKEFKKVSLEYYNGLTISLNLIYSYEEEYISFNYEANENNKEILLTGKYYSSGDTFECNLMDSSKNSISSNDKNTICNTIEKEVNHFFDESQSLFNNTKLTEKLSKLYN